MFGRVLCPAYAFSAPFWALCSLSCVWLADQHAFSGAHTSRTTPIMLIHLAGIISQKRDLNEWRFLKGNCARDLSSPLEGFESFCRRQCGGFSPKVSLYYIGGPQALAGIVLEMPASLVPYKTVQQPPKHQLSQITASCARNTRLIDTSLILRRWDGDAGPCM